MLAAAPARNCPDICCASACHFLSRPAFERACRRDPSGAYLLIGSKFSRESAPYRVPAVYARTHARRHAYTRAIAQSGLSPPLPPPPPQNLSVCSRTELLPNSCSGRCGSVLTSSARSGLIFSWVQMRSFKLKKIIYPGAREITTSRGRERACYSLWTGYIFR